MPAPYPVVALLLLLSLLSSALVAGAQQQLRPGDPFPEIVFPSPAAAADREYLQLTTPRFIPSQLQAELLVVELLNVHCPHCQMQAPAYNQLFRLIEADPAAKGKIKLLGLAVGNLASEVERFRRAYQVPFPVLADPDFAAWRKIGGGATPLSFLVRLDRTGGGGVIGGIQQGLNTHYQKLYAHLLKLAAKDPERLKERARSLVRQHQRVEPILSAAELEYRVRTAFIRFGTIQDFRQLSLLSGRNVFTALVRGEQGLTRLFAEISSRTSVCDICHDVHFIYLFDRSTRVLAFEPLQLTKYGNVDWSRDEVEWMRNRVVGKYLNLPKPFNPEVDAVSSATITSAMIFNSLAQGEELVEELRDQGLM